MTRIYVPSRGRVGRSSTLTSLAEEEHRDVVICTPPAERRAYRGQYAGLGWTVIAQDGEGIGPARQSILSHARLAGLDRFWMIDDDTRGAYIREGATRFKRSSISVIAAEMEAAISAMEQGGARGIAMFGPQFRHRAWGGDTLEVDVHLRNFVCASTDIEGDYWPLVKEDLDMVLQVITQGRHTVRFNVYAFDSPRMGTVDGGCFDDYAAGALDVATELLPKRWPGLVTIHLNPDTGYVENRVNWKAARSRIVKGPHELA